MSGGRTDDAFLVADERGVVVDVNDAGCGLFRRPKAELLGLHLAPHSQPDLLAEVGSRWSEMRASGAISGPARIERPDGDQTTVAYHAQFDLPVSGWTLVRLRPSNGAATQ